MQQRKSVLYITELNAELYYYYYTVLEEHSKIKMLYNGFFGKLCTDVYISYISFLNFEY